MTDTDIPTKILDKISDKIDGLVNSINLNKIWDPREQEIIRVTSEIIQNLSIAYKELIKAHKV